MRKHDRYQELCALAMAVEATGPEQRELKAHLDHCSECRQEYREFVQLVLPQLSLAMDAPPAAEPSAAEQQAIRSRFLARAQGAGIHFSEGAFSSPSGVSPRPAAIRMATVPRRKGRWFEAAIAAGGLLVAIGTGYLTSRNSAHPAAAPKALTEPKQPRMDTPAAIVALSTKDNAPRQDAGNELQSRLNVALQELNESRQLISQAEEEKTRLAADLKQKADQLSVLEAVRENSSSTIADLRAQLEQQNSKTAIEEANVMAHEVRIRDLTSQLAARNTQLDSDQVRLRDLASQLAARNMEVERDRQLMSVKGQNLMATRNLHIVDVFDSDTRGHIQGPFGRIFIIDGKQLIFYAYDLNETRLQNAKFTHRVWGQKEGPGNIAKALGTFSSDDSSQRRWIFTCDDPKILSQIDSVFVTVDPATSSHPHGEKLMYAYLRGPVNHH